MSDTQEELDFGDTQLEVVEPQPQLIWLGNIPVFIGDVDNTVDKAKAMGYQVFFVLGQDKGTATSGPTPRLYKVITNLIGRAISPVNNIDLGLEELSADAWFSLPEIPWSLISDINDFFRETYRLHGSEAIVMLTYDPIYLDDELRPEGTTKHDGWGVLTPEQENTSTSCDYKPESVIDEKPDEVFIVGTCHSHPGMSAFCSGTDKKDQANFDGVHITFGWTKGSTDTEFHCELQLGGAFTMKPEDLFLDMPKAVENERIKPWLDKVQKKTYTQSYSKHTAMGSGAGYNHYPSRGVGSGASSSLKKSEEQKRKEKYVNLPANCPIPEGATVIAKTWQSFDELTFCPCCTKLLKDEHFKKVRCSECMVYLMWNGLTLTNLIALRKESSMIALEIDPQEKPSKPIYIWEQKVTGDAEIVESVSCIWAGQGKASAGDEAQQVAPGHNWVYCPQCGEINSSDDLFCWNFGCDAPISLASRTVRDHVESRVLGTEETLFRAPNFGDDLGPIQNICCDRDWNLCTCDFPLEYDETESYVYDFCTQADIPMYADVNCNDCVHQYSASCPGFRQFLKDFIETKQWVPEEELVNSAPDPITVCSSWTGIEEFTDSVLSERE